MNNAPVMIMAGGTGGHIFPALAVARELDKRQVSVVWLGSEGGMETRIVPEHGIALETIKVQGIRGKNLKTLLLAPFRISSAVFQAIAVIRRHQPRSVLGMGGFASGPGGLAAFILGIPLYIHEQNSIPGMTNRWLAKVSRKTLAGFEGVLPGSVYVGNPVREDISAQAEPRARFKGREGPMKLLVVGGSLGALKFNQQIPVALSKLEGVSLDVLHQTGEKHLEVTQNAYTAAGVEAQVVPFIGDMATAYAEADLIIARAGALTVAEIQQVGVASVLVPYPHAVDDHQTTNAQALVAAGAAVLMPDSTFTAVSVAEQLQRLLQDRNTLLDMAIRARSMSRQDSAQNVARVCLNEEPIFNGGVA